MLKYNCIYLINNKRGENLKETLRLYMTKIRERNTAWYETIRNFFISDEEIENEDNNDKGYKEWKKANADSIDEKAIANLEKMLEHKDKKKRKTSKDPVVEKAETTQSITISKENEKDISDYERGE